jgi:hypothetical protein
MIYLSSLVAAKAAVGQRPPSRCLNAKKGDSVTPGIGLLPEIARTIKHPCQK